MNRERDKRLFASACAKVERTINWYKHNPPRTEDGRAFALRKIDAQRERADEIGRRIGMTFDALMQAKSHVRRVDKRRADLLPILAGVSVLGLLCLLLLWLLR